MARLTSLAWVAGFAATLTIFALGMAPLRAQNDVVATPADPQIIGGSSTNPLPVSSGTGTIGATIGVIPPAPGTGVPGMSGTVVDIGSVPTGTPPISLYPPIPTTTVPATGATSIVPLNPLEGKVLSKYEIRGQLEDGRYAEAEMSYIHWSAFWHMDDPVLFAQIEQGVLVHEYLDGSMTGLIALAQAGDPRARDILLSAVLADTVTQSDTAGATTQPLTAEELARMSEAVRIIGENGDKKIVNALMVILKSGTPDLALATIRDLGTLGDKRVIPELMKEFDRTDLTVSDNPTQDTLLAQTADLTKDVYLARALQRLGGAKLVITRFLPQLRFPGAETRIRAALILAAAGDASGWANVYQVVMNKPAPYYPLALVALGGLADGVANVKSALLGTEEEQLAALESIDIIPQSDRDALLLKLMGDATQPDAVRVRAIELLTAENNSDARKPIRNIAFSKDTTIPKAVTIAAIIAIAKLGMLNSTSARDELRRRIAEAADPDIVRACRAALLRQAYDAIKANGGVPPACPELVLLTTVR
jgi:HEAT repeat protein